MCSLYSVPFSTRKTQLIEPISLNYSDLKVKNRDFFFVMGGYKNNLDARNMLDISPSQYTMNIKPIHGSKNIDVLISDMANFNYESVILPNVPTYIPSSHQGGRQPSNHLVVTVSPMENRLKAPPQEILIKRKRRVNKEIMSKVAHWIHREIWETVCDGSSATCMVEKLTKLVIDKLDNICPIQEVKTRSSESHGRYNFTVCLDL